MKLLAYFFMMSISITSFANDFQTYEKICSEIGFKPKTQAFGECVLNVRAKDLGKQKQLAPQSNNQAIPKPQQLAISSVKDRPKGDGSNDDRTCEKYGFIVGDESYKRCRLELDTAGQQARAQLAQYNEQKRQYLEQKRLYEDEFEKQQAKHDSENVFKLLTFGAGMLGGRSASDAAPALYGLPMYQRQQPQAPVMQNFQLTTPRGSSNCNYNASMNQVNCN